jgi:hypothetical protein
MFINSLTRLISASRWLTQNGSRWLTQNGSRWLIPESGSRWLIPESGSRWLIPESGSRWLIQSGLQASWQRLTLNRLQVQVCR